MEMFPRRLAAGVLALAWLWPAQAAAEEAPPQPALELPIRCVIGETCWIVNYVDHDPSDGVSDYTCGTATYNAPPSNRHKGIDFAVRDMEAVRGGVEVLAAAPGTVIGVRDGMKDVNFKKIGGAQAVKGRECGNGVRIAHGGGWTTQYCHLRRGSVAVDKGDRVAAGQTLGMVGFSGLSEFPHLHLQVSKGKEVVDPFVGLERKGNCGPGERPLWKDAVMAGLPYRPTALYNAGFATEVPKAEAARNGLYRIGRVSPLAPALLLWVDIFRLRNGDQVIFRITGPDGEQVLEHRRTIDRDRVRGFFFAGKRRKGKSWQPGNYLGEVRLVREDGAEGREEYSLTRQVELR